MKKKPVYLDYMATTPLDPRVKQAMLSCMGMDGAFGNPASQTHVYGWEAQALVQQAQEQVAELINADPREIVWTSGATESDNLAIKGAAQFYQRSGKHIITMSTEHKAVRDTCASLESDGFEITYLNPKATGCLDLNELSQAIRPDTILISVMHVNNETGVIQDIAKIADIAKQRGIKCHVDAAQSAGKVSVDVKALSVDYLSFSGHKIYGPKGIGALFVRRTPRARLTPQIHGGGHQGGLRAGTLPTPLIVGMGEAFACAIKDREKDHEHIKRLRDQLWQGISDLGGVHVNGDPEHSIPGCMNLYFEGVDGESLITSMQDIAISSGSACNSANPEPSAILLAMGLSRQNAQASLRMSIGRFTTEEDIRRAIQSVREQVARLRNVSPLWDSVNASLRKK